MAERIEHCETCDEKTPHGLTGSSGSALTGQIMTLASPVWLFLGWPLLVLCVPTAVVGLSLWFSGRERFSHVDCQRCRHKQVLMLRAKKARRRFRLGPNTLIHPF